MNTRNQNDTRKKQTKWLKNLASNVVNMNKKLKEAILECMLVYKIRIKWFMTDNK